MLRQAFLELFALYLC